MGVQWQKITLGYTTFTQEQESGAAAGTDSQKSDSWNLASHGFFPIFISLYPDQDWGGSVAGFENTDHKNGTQVHCRTPFTHTCTLRGHLFYSNHLLAYFWEVDAHQFKNIRTKTNWSHVQKKGLKEKHFCSTLHNVIWRRTKVQVVKCGQVDISTSFLSHTHTCFRSYMVLIWSVELIKGFS